MMASHLITVCLSIAVFLIDWAQMGFSLECHTCYSQVSWDDCFNGQTSKVTDCDKFKVSLGMSDLACLNVFTAKKRNDNQQELEFVASCIPKQLCNQENQCKNSLYTGNKYVAAHCKIQCCETDRCNNRGIEASKGQISSLISLFGLINSIVLSFGFVNY